MLSPFMRAAVACALTVAAAALPAAAAPAAKVPGAYIVTLAEGDPAAAAERAQRRHGASVDHVYRHALRGYAARMSARAAAAVAQEPGVASVIADRTVRAYGELPTGVDRVDAEMSPTAAIDGADKRVNVDVAIIDTGIDTKHRDLNVVGGKNCSTGKSYGDGNGHGTHVAGTVGALDNGTGVVGVAPGARLWAVRVLNSQGSGTWSAVICGVDFVTANAATIEVANMSLGGTGTQSSCGGSDALHNAICRSVSAGVTYAVAAGNSSADSAGYVPANYGEVMTVSALADFNGLPGGGAAATCRSDVDDTFADFSNYGSAVDLIAPGVCITSTWKGGGYNTISGTSMASPHVAGAAALYKAGKPLASPSEVAGALKSAGTNEWDNHDDGDEVKEPLLNVAKF